MKPIALLRRVLAPTLLLLTLGLDHGAGQAIQAVRSRGTSRDSLKGVVRGFADSVSMVLAQYGVTVARLSQARGDNEEDRMSRALIPVAERARELARATLDAEHDPERFLRRLRVLRAYLEGLEQSGELRRIRDGSSAPGFSIRAAPSELFKVPDVAFVIGATLMVGKGTTVGQAEVSTNLLGAAAGAAFETMGATALKEYFEDNLAVGTAFPFGGEHKLAAVLGVGLGGLRVGRFSIWPAINIEQADSGDHRVPDAIRSLGTSANWSSPMLSVAVSPWDLSAINAGVKEGKVMPVFTLAVRLPYYYPNDPFSAVAALFSDKRGDYQKKGKAQFQVGVYFPLQRLKRIE